MRRWERAHLPEVWADVAPARTRLQPASRGVVKGVADCLGWLRRCSSGLSSLRVRQRQWRSVATSVTFLALWAVLVLDLGQLCAVVGRSRSRRRGVAQARRLPLVYHGYQRFLYLCTGVPTYSLQVALVDEVFTRQGLQQVFNGAELIC